VIVTRPVAFMRTRRNRQLQNDVKELEKAQKLG
jgi:hypothetical protein